MPTKRQNLLETIRGGKPVVNQWGVTISFPEDMPGPFPVHDEEFIVCKDPEHWRDYVKAPSIDYTDEDWAPFVKAVEEIARDEYFVTPYDEVVEKSPHGYNYRTRRGSSRGQGPPRIG